MFKSLALSFNAFFSNPLKFVADPANAIAEYRVKTLVAEGATADQIEAELKRAGLLKGAGPVKVIIDTVGQVLEILLKYLPLILLGLAVLFVLFYFRPFGKALK
jgi:hypothetical protein